MSNTDNITYNTSGSNYAASTDLAFSSSYLGDYAIIKVEKKKGISPELYFKYVKSKFGFLEGRRIESRMKKLEKAFNHAVENGQIFLGNKIMVDLIRETRESVMYAKGIRYFIEREDLWKHKNKIREGHISDTKFEDFTRVIPTDILEKKKKTEGMFDGYVILHYYNNDSEEKIQKKQKMSNEEISRMKDPVLFGWIKESSRFYFIADWDDEFCDLSFDEIVDVIGKGENKGDDSFEISRNPRF